MKNCFFIIILIVLFAGRYFPQTVDIPFIFYDGAFTNTDLHVGLDSTATYGIDYQLGEFVVPINLPPTGLLQLWFFLDSLELATFRDYRYAPSFPYSGSSIHIISGFLSSDATEFTIIYDFPQGVTANVKDFFGGTIFNQDLSDSGTYSFPMASCLPILLTMFYDNVIPVELFSFTAKLNTASVELKWTTITEINNSGFEIQRLQNSENEELKNWKRIGFISGFGTTTEPKSYSFTDDLSLRENVTSGIYKYRLKQIDFDGTFNFSKEIEVKVNLIPDNYILKQNYLNPFNPVTTIGIAIPEVAHVSLIIYNTLGQIAVILENSVLEAGSYQYQWNAKNFASGIYICELRTEKYTSLKKLLLLK